MCAHTHFVWDPQWHSVLDDGHSCFFSPIGVNFTHGYGSGSYFKAQLELTVLMFRICSTVRILTSLNSQSFFFFKKNVNLKTINKKPSSKLCDELKEQMKLL